MSKTISITIPDQLEKDLKKKSKSIGISRSRFIGNILLNWQKANKQEINNCANQNDGYCNNLGIVCVAPQHEAETCSHYINKEQKVIKKCLYKPNTDQNHSKHFLEIKKQ